VNVKFKIKRVYIPAYHSSHAKGDNRDRTPKENLRSQRQSMPKLQNRKCASTASAYIPFIRTFLLRVCVPCICICVPLRPSIVKTISLLPVLTDISITTADSTVYRFTISSADSAVITCPRVCQKFASFRFIALNLNI